MSTWTSRTLTRAAATDPQASVTNEKMDAWMSVAIGKVIQEQKEALADRDVRIDELETDLTELERVVKEQAEMIDGIVQGVWGEKGIPSDKPEEDLVEEQLQQKMKRVYAALDKLEQQQEANAISRDQYWGEDK